MPRIPEGPVIPRQTYSLVRKVTTQRRLHAGLMLDKFSVFPKVDSEKQEKIMEAQRDALTKVCQSLGNDDLLRALCARRTNMLSALGAHTLSMRTQGALTLHLSHPGAWENAGIAFHPIYGFVYIPGSGLKGLARAWAETIWAPAQSDKEVAWHLIEDAFGYTPESERGKKMTKDSGWRPPDLSFRDHSAAGRLVFHDAWPYQWPCLEVDITNSHHSKYYEGNSNQAPDDTENPIPVYFLAVGSDKEFQFAVSDRNQHSDSLAEQGINWLRDALTAEGAGAKTAAGYGRFVAEKPVSVLKSPRIIRKEYALELISMAFLAGATQKEQDCDLRPATLRGLLRWWWRTMHSEHVDLETLRQLEAVIWGDSDNGSPVRIQLQRSKSTEVSLFKKEDFKWLSNQNQGGRRQTLGLAYASYGMGEVYRQRWYCSEGSTWHLTVSVRSGYYGSGREQIPLTADIIHRQVEAALWLFTQFGGAGSKSRKGFGSFSGVKIEGISSIENCKTVGAELRDACSLRSERSVKSPALERAIIMDDQPVGSPDPIVAVHFIGELIQQYAIKLKQEGRSRAALGTPRARSRYPRGIPQRHASPALWSLSRDGKGMLQVRLIGFPSDQLPQSNTILQDLCDYARRTLEK